jgi:uncharacterized protein (TIGR02147 family)
MPTNPSEYPLIFLYLDYREYLAAYFAFRKAGDKAFSLRAFAKRPELKLSSSSFLSAILSGRKNLSQNLRIRFGQALGLKLAEMEYFEILIQFNQSKSPDEKKHFFAQLSRYHAPKARVLQDTQHRFYAHWHYSVVWNIIGIRPDLSNPILIGKSLVPPLSAQQVEEAIRVLLELKLIKRMANGYAVIDRHLTSSKTFRGPLARQQYREFLQTAQTSIDLVPASERKLNLMSFSASTAAMTKIKERLETFRNEMRKIIDADSGEDRVYALAFQLIPCSSAGKEFPLNEILEGKGPKLGTTSESGNPEV